MSTEEAGGRSLTGTKWLGHCPLHPAREMCLNQSNIWECPECSLQICCGTTIYVLKERGVANFKTTGHGIRELAQNSEFAAFSFGDRIDIDLRSEETL